MDRKHFACNALDRNSQLALGIKDPLLKQEIRLLNLGLIFGSTSKFHNQHSRTMPDETVPSKVAKNPQGLAIVPLTPEPSSAPATMPIGGSLGTGRLVAGTKPVSVPVGTVPGPVGPSPATVPVGSSKRAIIGVSVVAAGLAAFSGYEFLQAKELQGKLVDAQNLTASANKTNQTLESDLKTAREGLAAESKAHESAISEKDQELTAARTKAGEASEELAKETEKNKELLAKVEAAIPAIEEKDRLVNEVAELKKANEELDGQKVKAMEEAERLTQELASRKSAIAAPAASIQDMPSPVKTLVKTEDQPEVSEKKTRGTKLAWVRLGKYENGKNKGRWYYVAPDGFMSPLYSSRESTIYQAELRAGFAQPDLETPEQIKTEVISTK